MVNRAYRINEPACDFSRASSNKVTALRAIFDIHLSPPDVYRPHISRVSRVLRRECKREILDLSRLSPPVSARKRICAFASNPPSYENESLPKWERHTVSLDSDNGRWPVRRKNAVSFIWSRSSCSLMIGSLLQTDSFGNQRMDSQAPT